MISPQPSFAKYASIIVNETTGKVMYARNADRRLFPASLTKVMTLYIVFEEIEAGRLSLDTRMKVSRVAAGRSPSKLWLRPGSTIRTRDAVMALITKSANDVATVVAEHIGGTEREFAKRMTRKARSLGMTNTTFRNASGLPHSKQRSTARDMARLAIAMRKDFPQYFHLFKSKSFSWKGKRFRNHNKLLSNYKGTDGIKTGYTNASGFNLIATVERNGTRLVGVVFGGRTGKSRDKHMRYLLTKQFNRLPALKAPTLRQAKAPTIAPPPPKPKQIKVFRDQKSIALAASAKPAPPPDLPVLADPVAEKPNPVQDWGIQIGSFARQANAHTAARDARHAAVSFLRRQPALVRPVQFGSVVFWQVQFRGFNEDQAREACFELHQTGMACIAVPAPRV
ncbi:MAG: serine hydrolase [Candidatus Puniceispirillales bacterium]